MRRFLASVMRAVAAALALAPRLVWEGGKWVARTFFPGAPQEQTVAEQEMMEELLRPREIPAAVTGYENPDEAWGRAASDHLIPLGTPLHRPEEILDERAMSYLDSLDLSERSALLAHDARHIGQHLMGERKLKGLPPVPTAQQFNDAEGARLRSLAGPVAEELRRVQKKVDGVAALMREQGYEPVYEPTFRPRAA